MLFTKEMIASMGYKSAEEFAMDYSKKHRNSFISFRPDGSVSADFDYDSEPGMENEGYIDEAPDVEMPDPERLDPSFLIQFVRQNSSFDADLLAKIIEEWKQFKKLGSCGECKHWEEQIAYCELNSYFVDHEGLCCSPAESPNWTMWDKEEFCSRFERRADDGSV